VRISAHLISKRSTAREECPGGAGVTKRKGSFGLFCLPAPGMPAMTPDLDRARIELKQIRLKKSVFLLKDPKNGPNSR
jgi:hypothetical protein